MAGAWIWRPLEIRRERSPGRLARTLHLSNECKERRPRMGLLRSLLCWQDVMFWQEWPCELVISTIANCQLPIDIKFYVYIMRDREQCLVDNG